MRRHPPPRGLRCRSSPATWTWTPSGATSTSPRSTPSSVGPGAPPGGLDLAVTADTVEPGRVRTYERWVSAAELRAFRERADPFDLQRDSDVGGVLAQANVGDLDVAEKWYATLLGREPDARPMPGLLTWHLLGAETGVQLWVDPERAGGSSMVLAVDDIDGLAQRWTPPVSSTAVRSR